MFDISISPCYNESVGRLPKARRHRQKGGIGMKRNGLSGKQEEILNYIKDEILKKGYPPAVREICSAVGLRSTSSVHAHLETLERMGYIRRDPTKPRTIEIADDVFYGVGRQEVFSVPLVGRVAAGEPILAQEHIESYFPYPAAELPAGADNIFMLEVHGESMINAGILDGDRILVREQSTAHNGEIVVALIEESATVKRFYKENGYFRLQPENDEMEPIIVQDCRILGKVIALIRSYR